MHVGVDEPGQHRAPFGVDHTARHAREATPDGNDPTGSDDHIRLHDAAVVLGGNHEAAADDQVGVRAGPQAGPATSS